MTTTAATMSSLLQCGTRTLSLRRFCAFFAINDTPNKRAFCSSAAAAAAAAPGTGSLPTSNEEAAGGVRVGGVDGGSNNSYYAGGPSTRMNMVAAVNAGIRTAMETDGTAVREPER